ncbi:hypothetical protein GOP47_0017950 [Adiantum capillus-veneris]|uniref:Thioredoxin domain-containing protein n=1 Tax=Adiantum capillus-veneris TaxID=13818 RepID=A0A9D4UGU8_ADICA|nr:hypothetical protein GOP47_0017950 [Adiantum capillus-veneris]
MASLVLGASGAIVCGQPKELTGSNTKGFNSIPGFRGQLSSGVLHDKCLLGFSSTSSTQRKHAWWIARSVSEEAATEIEGGVMEVEDEATLEQYFREAGDKLVVLDISTKTCGPCKMIYPKLVKMSKEYPDAVFLKIMGDLNSGTRALMRKWGVRAVPNFRFFRNGELIHSHSGANEDELRRNFLAHYEK